MRDDMAKVLVERPRHGRGLKYPRGVDRGPMEERPRHESIKSPHADNRKHLNENLAPLRRFLLSRVGRRWDDVYSEICERINRNSAVQLHIWQHLMWEVRRSPIEIERMMASTWYGCRPVLYVDPRTRQLREWRLPGRASRPRRAEPPFLVRRRGRTYKEINRIWYEVELAPVPTGVGKVWDAILSQPELGEAGYADHGTLRKWYGELTYAVRKRQLNTNEIRRLVTSDR